MGNLSNEKNIFIVKTLIDRIWPEIRKILKDVELHIIGSGFNQELHNQKKELQKIGVMLKGTVESTE